jgi:hypothetical protein
MLGGTARCLFVKVMACDPSEDGLEREPHEVGRDAETLGPAASVREDVGALVGVGESLREVLR